MKRIMVVCIALWSCRGRDADDLIAKIDEGNSTVCGASVIGLRVSQRLIFGMEFCETRIAHGEFLDITFEGCVFDGGGLFASRFVRCSFVGCRFEGVNLRKAEFVDCEFDDVSSVINSRSWYLALWGHKEKEELCAEAVERKIPFPRREVRLEMGEEAAVDVSTWYDWRDVLCLEAK